MTDPRIDRLERDVDRIQEEINNLHSGSMQLVTTAFTEMERRLGLKIDEQTREVVRRLEAQSDRISKIELAMPKYVTRSVLFGLVAFLVVQFLVIIGLALGLLYEILSRH